ncbi:MAG: hypothetical protein M1822_008886 [Bathelium mastoideum]|nr:MAG: hypothetical protein M1822_008886 [Bathelium mastoideum]
MPRQRRIVRIPSIPQLITGNVQSPTTVSAARTPLHPFEKKVEDVKPSKTDINLVIMDYLINEGFPSAAKKFASEANIAPTGDTESIQERVEIKNAIHAGDIQTAIEKINDLNPQILDTDTALHFSLLRLQLIELIRNCVAPTSSSSSSTTLNPPDITPALNFASTQLAPRAPTSPNFLTDLEQTMALLIFPSDNLSPTLAPLLDPQLRRDVAAAVNEAILTSQGWRRQARIRDLVRVRAWAEAKVRESGGGGGARDKLPERLGLGLDGEDGKEVGKEGNGEGEAMVT